MFSCGFLKKSGGFGRLIVISMWCFVIGPLLSDLYDQLALLNALETPVLIVPAASVAIS